MSGSLLFDTSVVTPFFRGDEGLRERFSGEDRGFVSATVLGELEYGARKSARPAANLQQVDDLAAIMSVLAVDHDTAREYGVIKDALRLQGRMIPENDIWIAAVARQHDLTLVTRDAHYALVPDLRVEEW